MIQQAQALTGRNDIRIPKVFVIQLGDQYPILSGGRIGRLQHEDMAFALHIRGGNHREFGRGFWQLIDGIQAHDVTAIMQQRGVDIFIVEPTYVD